jgi:hypothetical protein
MFGMSGPGPSRALELLPAWLFGGRTSFLFWLCAGLVRRLPSVASLLHVSLLLGRSRLRGAAVSRWVEPPSELMVDAEQPVPQLVGHVALRHVPSVALGFHRRRGGELVELLCAEIDVAPCSRRLPAGSTGICFRSPSDHSLNRACNTLMSYAVLALFSGCGPAAPMFCPAITRGFRSLSHLIRMNRCRRHLRFHGNVLFGIGHNPLSHPIHEPCRRTVCYRVGTR